MGNKTVFVLAVLPFLFSCQSPATKAQHDQFEQCKKELLENKADFLALMPTQEKKDSVLEFLNDLEQDHLDDQLRKYDIADENIDAYISTICNNAELAKTNKTILQGLHTADSALRLIDSFQHRDSVIKK